MIIMKSYLNKNIYQKRVNFYFGQEKKSFVEQFFFRSRASPHILVNVVMEVIKKVDGGAHKATMVVTFLLLLKVELILLIQGENRFKWSSLTKVKKQHYYGTSGPKKSNTNQMQDIRWQRIVSSDLESIPVGLVVLWGSLFSAASPSVHSLLACTYLISRVAHTIFYANAIPQSVPFAWFGGFASVIGLALNGVLGVLCQ
eukprot:TRINITY_DN1998_c0_g1_i4.p1 TRINITY_DN1998_c0_g1~~TRINITY_DN1998_c0_g1_i4.p1  ORF type:complete len:200 (+),score=13.86 TRINITY_DN1998_c0_g1_i4:872-1471(+)